jgi:hypothetical protein
MKPAFPLLLATLALSACQDSDKSYDAIHGPENTLQAPLFSEDNRQIDPTNRKLMEMAKEDSLFYTKKKAAEEAAPSTDTSATAGAVADTSALSTPPTPPVPTAAH